MQILHSVASTFRGRAMSFAQLQAASTRKPNAASVDKWDVYKKLCIAKAVFGLNDRCLAVLSSLLSFYPENEISEKNGLVVFPSNRQLSLRAHGMAEATLRRHIAALVGAGLIVRRDSPNGKRYAYKDREGQVEEAFGFSFAPLLDRVEEIAKAADKIQQEAKQLRRTREQITLQRRDMTQIFDTALQANDAASSAKWAEAYERFRAIINAIPRRATIEELTYILDQLVSLRQIVDNLLNIKENDEEMSANDAQIERQYNESLTESLFESQNVKRNDLKANSPVRTEHSKSEVQQPHTETVPLDMVLRACPDIRDYAPDGITSWRDLANASHLVSGFLGITKSAYTEASQIMGLQGVSAIIAWLLQRAGDIQSPGGYLRSLTQKARGGGLSITQIMIAGMKRNAGFSSAIA